MHDFRYALRTLRKTPGFTALAVLTLALGLGANTAIFTIVQAVLLRPLPYKDPGRLAMLWTTSTRPNIIKDGSASYRDFQQWQAQSRLFRDLSVFYRQGWSVLTLTGGAEPERIQGAYVSADFFPMMGVPPILGRTFSPAESRRGERLVVLSHGLWQRRFASSPQALGAAIETDAGRWRIIGVMPPRFEFPFHNVQLWAPILAHPQWNDRGESEPLSGPRWFVAGRLQPGVSCRQAQAEMSAIAARMEGEAPDTHQGFGVQVIPLREHLTGNVRTALSVLFGAVLFVLLIACTNLASLFLARGASRMREFAVRAALGAGRGRLLRQLLIESAVLSLLAGCLGLLAAAPAIRALKAFAPQDIPRLDEAGIDPGVLLFAFGIALIAGLASAVAPAWKVSRANPNDYLKEGGRSGAAGWRGRRAHGWLVAVQFALAVILLAGAGLLIRSFLAVLAVDPGFRPESVLLVRTAFPAGTPPERITGFYREALARVRELPGVRAAGAISNLFYLGESRMHALRQVEGRPPEPLSQWKPLVWTRVRGDYFQAMGIPLLAGRYFTEQDDRNAPLVAIVNETLARRYWPGENPLGKRLKGFDPRGRRDDWLTVAGVVRDTHNYGLEKRPIAQIYEPQLQSGETTPDLVIRAASDPLRFVAAVRAALRAADRSVVLTAITTMESRLEEQTAQRRFQTWLLGVFSAFALALAAVGIYGVMHYSVARRTHEIGLRMALGARAAGVFGMVIRQGLRFVLAGLAAGLLGALWLAQAISGMLYGVAGADPLTFAAVSALLIVVALVACYVPALRATRVDPLVALRHE